MSFFRHLNDIPVVLQVLTPRGCADQCIWYIIHHNVACTAFCTHCQPKFAGVDKSVGGRTELFIHRVTTLLLSYWQPVDTGQTPSSPHRPSMRSSWLFVLGYFTLSSSLPAPGHLCADACLCDQWTQHRPVCRACARIYATMDCICLC